MNNVTTYLRPNYKRKDGKIPVYCMVSIKGEKVRFNTGVAVADDEWNKTDCRIRGKSKDAKDNNLIISECEARINDVFVRYRLMHREVTPDVLRREYETPSTYVDLIDFITRTMEKKKGLNAENTIKTHKTMLDKLSSFRKEILFPDFTGDMVNDFKKYLKNKKNNNPNTINKSMRILKIYAMEAMRKKLIVENPFAAVKIKQIYGDRTFLEPFELRKLVELYKRNSLPAMYVTTLRAFLFSCFTGLRISDVRAIKMEDIAGSQIVFSPVKTRGIQKVVHIPLRKPAKMLIKDASPHRLIGPIFNMDTDQQVNKKIKDICTHVDIDKKISFHCGRHTFATIFLREGGKVEVLQKLLGHTSITETMKYVHVLPESIEEQMNVFDKYA